MMQEYQSLFVRDFQDCLMHNGHYRIQNTSEATSTGGTFTFWCADGVRVWTIQNKRATRRFRSYSKKEDVCANFEVVSFWDFHHLLRWQQQQLGVER